MSESAFVNNVVVAIKVTVVVAFIAIGGFFVDPALWSPLVPAAVPAPAGDPGLWSEIGSALWAVVTAQNTGQYGVSGIITAAATIFFAYIGFEAVSTAGAESRNPRRDMPIGILGSLIICTILYILTSAVLVGIVPYTDLNDAAPLAKAVNQIGLPWFAVLVKIGAIAGLSSVMLVLLYGQTRIFMVMSRDGLLPTVFSRVHARFRTPHVSTWVTGIVVALSCSLLTPDQAIKVLREGKTLIRPGAGPKERRRFHDRPVDARQRARPGPLQSAGDDSRVDRSLPDRTRHAAPCATEVAARCARRP